MELFSETISLNKFTSSNVILSCGKRAESAAFSKPFKKFNYNKNKIFLLIDYNKSK